MAQPKPSRGRPVSKNKFTRTTGVRHHDAQRAVWAAEAERRSKATGIPWTLSDYLRFAGDACVGGPIENRQMPSIRPSRALPQGQDAIWTVSDYLHLPRIQRVHALRQVQEAILKVLSAQQALRGNFAVDEWIAAERKAVLDETNAWRFRQGKTPVTEEQICRVEQWACGHADYSTKFAWYCAELALDCSPSTKSAG